MISALQESSMKNQAIDSQMSIKKIQRFNYDMISNNNN